MTIENLIDKYLYYLISDGGNFANEDGNSEAYYLDEAGDLRWAALPSRATDAQIAVIEQKIGHILPNTYKRLLKHKHFEELYIGDCTFYGHTVEHWDTNFIEHVLYTYDNEFLIDNGKIPFASYQDYGWFCFDTKAECAQNDYPIVVLGHEDYSEIATYKNFIEMLAMQDEVD